MKKTKMLLAALFISFLFWNCTDDSPAAPVLDENGSTQQANDGMMLLNEKLMDLNINPNPQNGGDVFSLTDYNNIKGKFTEALRLNPNNSTANLGMGILEIASVNYDNELWGMITEIDTAMGKKRVFNNQVKMVLDLPRFWLNFSHGTLTKGNALTVARVQNLIDQRILPKINSAISCIDKALNTSVMIDNGEEVVEIDNGEVYLFRSSLYAVKAVMQMITLYDVDLFDANNSYNWVENLNTNSSDERKVIQSNDTLYIKNYDNSFVSDSITASIVKRNLESRPGFLKHRNGNSPVAVKLSLLSFLSDVENSVTYIENESDEQSNDLIKKANIIDLNNGVTDLNDGTINYTFTTVHNLISWLKTSINGTTFQVTADGVNGMPVRLDINVGTMFNTGITDMREILPYHRWKTVSAWKVEQLDYSYTYFNYNSNGSYTDWYTGMTYTGVYYIAYLDYNIKAEPLEFLNAPNGTVISPDEDLYLPDYTIKGLFPNMTRSKFYTIFG